MAPSDPPLRGGLFDRQPRLQQPFVYMMPSKRSTSSFSSSGRAVVSRSLNSRPGAKEEKQRSSSNPGRNAISASESLPSSSGPAYATGGSSTAMTQKSTVHMLHTMPAFVAEKADKMDGGAPSNTAHVSVSPHVELAHGHIPEYLAANRQHSLRKALSSPFRGAHRSNIAAALPDQVSGNDEDELDELCIDAILRPSHTPTSSQQDRFSEGDTLPLPVPSSQSSLLPHLPLSESLFTPPVSPPSHPRKRKCPKFSHIAVPSFPPGSGKHDYKPMRQSNLFVKRPANTGTRVHTSISDALQAAMMHNASVGTPESAFPVVGSSKYPDSRPDRRKTRMEKATTGFSRRKAFVDIPTLSSVRHKGQQSDGAQSRIKDTQRESIKLDKGKGRVKDRAMESSESQDLPRDGANQRLVDVLAGLSKSAQSRPDNDRTGLGGTTAGSSRSKDIQQDGPVVGSEMVIPGSEGRNGYGLDDNATGADAITVLSKVGRPNGIAVGETSPGLAEGRQMVNVGERADGTLKRKPSRPGSPGRESMSTKKSKVVIGDTNTSPKGGKQTLDAKVKPLHVWNGLQPTSLHVTACSSMAETNSSSAREDNALNSDSSKLLPPFDDSAAATNAIAEEISSDGGLSATGRHRAKRKRRVPYCSSPRDENSQDRLDVALTENDAVSQQEFGNLQPGVHTPRTPNSKRSNKTRRDSEKTPLNSSFTSPDRNRLAALKSPATKHNHNRKGHNPLLPELPSTPGGPSNEMAVDSHGLSSPTRPQLQPSPSGFLAELEGNMALDADLSADLDHFFNNLDQPPTSVSPSAPGNSFRGHGIINSGHDIILAEGMSNFDDSNELFNLSMYLSSPEADLPLELQQTKANGSLPPSNADVIPFPSSPSPGSSLALKDAIVHGDVDQWLIDDENHRHPSLSSTSTNEISGIGTIDPSLLVGGLVESRNSSPSPPVSRSTSPESVTDSSKTASPRSKSSWPKTLVESRNPSRRALRAPVRADMVVTDQLSLSSDWEGTSSSSSSDGSEFKAKYAKPNKPTGTSRPRMSYTECLSPSNPGLLPKNAKVGRPKKIKVPISVGDEFSFCHHCRRTTWKEKMTCSGVRKTGEPCGKNFCDLCITKHYPEITFDLNNSAFICPYCDETCRCSLCTRKRGEVYIGERTREPAPLEVGIGNTRERRTRMPVAKSLPPLPTPDPVLAAKATTFWGTIYGLTGERVGKAFVADDGDDRFVVAKPTVTTGTVPRTHVRKRRVFVGKVQEWWGIKGVRDLEPMPRQKRKEKLTGVRFYIGKKAFLGRRVVVPARPPSPVLSMGSSDLTELSDDEGGEGAGKLKDKPEELPPGVVILGEADVERAIAAAVAALAPTT